MLHGIDIKSEDKLRFFASKAWVTDHDSWVLAIGDEISELSIYDAKDPIGLVVEREIQCKQIAIDIPN